MNSLAFAHQIPAEISLPLIPNLNLIAKYEAADLGHPSRPIMYPVQLDGQRSDRAERIHHDFQWVSWAVHEEIQRFLDSFYSTTDQ